MTVLFLKENIIMKMSGKNRWRRKYPIMQIEKKNTGKEKKKCNALSTEVHRLTGRLFCLLFVSKNLI